MAKKNPAAVALGKLAAAKRSKEELQEAGRRGGLQKAANRQNGSRIEDLADAVHDHFTALGTRGTPAKQHGPKGLKHKPKKGK